MATYASLGEDHAVHHMPLKYALTEYQDDRDKLLALLSCLNRAAEVSDLIAELVESGEMFHVLRFTGKEAYQFLRDVEKIEQTGILCRIPNWWRKRAMECSVEIRLGEKKPAMVGFDSLISYAVSIGTSAYFLLLASVLTTGLSGFNIFKHKDNQ